MPALEFYATRDDLLAVMAAAEAQLPLVYAAMGQYEQPEVQLFSSATSIPDFGIAKLGVSLYEQSFLLLLEGELPQFRVIDRNDGSQVYALDQVANARSATLRPGGEYVNAVVAGQVATIAQSGEAKAIYSTVTRHLRRAFGRFGAYWVGSGALERGRSGARLTPSVEASLTYDLVTSARP
jgi:hypothetical protein